MKREEDDVQIEVGEEHEKKPLVDNSDDKEVKSTTSSAPTNSRLRTIFYILGNIASSVALIMVNKIVMEKHGFSYVIVLTALHFSFTAILFGIMVFAGAMETKELPLKPCLTTSLANVGSIVFMNFSLHTNSVGFYQITKLMCIPVMVFVETVFYGKTFSNKIKLTLLMLCAGVAIVTVTDMRLNLAGFIYGVLAILCTSLSQIALGDNQKVHNLTSVQLLENLIAPQALITIVFAIPIELVPSIDGIVYTMLSKSTLALIVLSCLISISVNFFTIALIGATSAVTYQVVGHTKTCLILVLGFLLFPINTPTPTLIKNIFGISTAVVGVVLYGHFKTNNK
ncbi:hypothetical protein AKO1_007124 [Acrasis kona]|uniref:Sugar phosphate transporter domain-containing protein n=1 Tax=Acrasis kona TaxID=1008807 RepID=A0AAW2YSE4_9EUKA